ncbi:hypothetical protein Emin_1124 [Elusimicrobium minutum Pei191]|uniref:Protein BatD n=1 Tax=Elusimicrobium minutum (strain Pei191) TaxID=445932 RepID=B2KDT0_ELUMP|nr:hypothetical protein [Elusimicrobium minutum]ACC98676.1 hypothetical protein Emin_1124 [Elusimicrobium minutum Pei191]
MKFFKLLLLFCLLLISLNSYTQEERIIAPKKAALVGSVPKASLAKPFHITFNIADVNAHAIFFDLESVNAKDYEVINTAVMQVGDGVEYTLTVMPFVLGETEFAPVMWNIEGGQTAKSEPVKLKIDKAETGIIKKDIVDIRGPYRPFDIWFLLKVLIFALLTAFLIILFRKLKNRKPVSAPQKSKVIDNRPLEVKVKARISELLASGLWEAGEYKEFYIELTEILRFYLSKRFSINADVQTTFELLRNIKASKAADILDDARAFLNGADLVKFAKLAPSVKNRETDISILNRIIDKTTPAPAKEGK